MNLKKELKRIAEAIEKEENISYNDLFILENHKKAVYNTGNIRLCEWAGIPEEEFRSGKITA